MSDLRNPGAEDGESILTLSALTVAYRSGRKWQDKYAKQQRALWIIFCFDIALTIAVCVLSLVTYSQGVTIHQSQVNACATGNDLRAKQAAFSLSWVSLVERGAKQTPALRAFNQKYDALVAKSFPQLDCAAIYKT